MRFTDQSHEEYSFLSLCSKGNVQLIVDYQSIPPNGKDFDQYYLVEKYLLHVKSTFEQSIITSSNDRNSLIFSLNRSSLTSSYPAYAAICNGVDRLELVTLT